MGKKITWSKLKFPRKGRHGKQEEQEETDSLMSKSANVSEEYKEAFRTKSYIEICEKVQGGQHEITTNLDDGPSSPLTHHEHFFEHFLEPHQQTLISIIETSNHHEFLASYLEVTVEASRTCESLLTKIHRARKSYRAIKNVIKLIKRVPDCKNWTPDYCHTVYKNLAWLAKQRNPFSTTSPQNFQELHNDHEILLQKLTSKCRKTKRRAKFIKVIKKSMASFLVIGCGALAVALLILAMHTMVVVMAAPGLILGSLGFSMMKKNRQTGQKFNEKWLQGLARKLDIAARGVYIMMNDFGTISRLVRRLHDEMEHRKFIADVCVRKGKIEMVKEVVKEFQMHDSCFLEELEELEKQIYLCFLDIYRSRRLLVREINR